MQQKIKTSVFNQDESDQPKYQLTVRLPRDVFRRIESESEKTGVSLAEVVRRYVNRGIKR